MRETATTSPDSHYDAFRRAHGLWAGDGKFFVGVFADSPSAIGGEDPDNLYAPSGVYWGPVTKLGWLTGTEYANDDDFWATIELSPAEAGAFMARPEFVAYGSPEGDEAFAAWEARVS